MPVPSLASPAEGLATGLQTGYLALWVASAWFTPYGMRRLWHHAVCHCFQRLTLYPGAYGDTPPDVKWSVQLTAPQLVDLFDHEWDERIKEPALHRLGVWSSLLCPGGARQVCGQPSLLWHRCPFRCPGCMLASGALCVSDHGGKGMGRDACGVIQRRSGGLREARTHSIPSCDGMCHC